LCARLYLYSFVCVTVLTRMRLYLPVYATAPALVRDCTYTCAGLYLLLCVTVPTHVQDLYSLMCVTVLVS
jgi:hypothetical protein